MIGLVAFVLAALPPTPTAAQILARAQHAYDSVRTLEETVKGTIGRSTGTAHIYFQRPAKLSVSGTSLFGSKYKLVSDGRTTWVLNGNTWSKAASEEMGIATITGIAANAGTAVPAALVHARFGNILKLYDPVQAVKTTLGGRPVYRLYTERPFPTTVWIDSHSFMLVKTLVVAIGQQINVQFDPPKVNGPVPAKAFTR